jgi:formylmethanofuran dehydrogenase subunit C
VIFLIEVTAAGEACLCDFTFDFLWQHKGSRLNPDTTVGGYSYRNMVKSLAEGDTITILGDVGSRLGSSMGVDLIRLGGKGGPLENTGKIIVDGDVGSRMGISMLRGAIYVSGKVASPMGNVIEVASDLSGFRKFISITEALEKSLPISKPNHLDEQGLAICDKVLRDTVGARNSASKRILLIGNAGLSSGILMQSGLLDISGNAENNTGVLLRGGRIVVRGSTGDFTGSEMRSGMIIAAESAGDYACAKMKGGAIFAKEGKPLPPAQALPLTPVEQAFISKALGIVPFYAMMYRRFCLNIPLPDLR